MAVSGRTFAVDCQVFQTPTWGRGMGRYSFSLLKHILAQGLVDDSEVVLVLNRNLSPAGDRLAPLKALRPDAREAVLDLPVAWQPGIGVSHQRASRRSLDAFFAEGGRDATSVDFLILSSFTFDFFAAFPSGARRVLLFYDLIPLVMWEQFRRTLHPDPYFSRFDVIYEADRILAISQATADDLVVHLGLDRSRISVIHGAHFEHAAGATAEGPRLPKRFVLLPTADLPHKNNERAVAAFAALPEQLLDGLRLMITSAFTDRARRRLQELSSSLVFAGEVPDSAMERLYRRAEVVVVPSLKEGLGMPVLEAVNTRRRVACSDIAAFRDISRQGFYYFDPLDTTSIRDALSAALQGEGWDARQTEYRRVARQYTWKHSAEHAVAAVSATRRREQAGPRPRWAVLCAHPRTGAPAGALMQYLADALGECVDLVFYLHGGGASAAFLQYVAPCHDVERFGTREFAWFDEVVYALDGTRFSSEAARRAAVMPGRLLLCSDGVANLRLLANSQRMVIVPDARAADTVKGLLIRDVPVITLETPSADPGQRVNFDPRGFVRDLCSACGTASGGNQSVVHYLRSTRRPRRRRILELFTQQGSASHA